MMQIINLLLFSSAFISAEASVLRREPAAFHDYGELRLAVTDENVLLWDDAGSGAKRNVGLWHPRRNGNFRAFGSIAENIHAEKFDANGKRATLFATLNPNQPPKDASKPALKESTGWTLVWDDKGSGATRDGSVWRPKCDSGYVSLGDVGSGSHQQPTASVWCVRRDFAKEGKYNTETLWDDGKSGAKKDAYLWEVAPRSNGPSGAERIPLYTGTFRIMTKTGEPDIRAWVLSVNIPKEESKFNATVPKVTADNIPTPGKKYYEEEEGGAILPLTAVFKPKDLKLLDNIGRPFARISRFVRWEATRVWVNRSNGKVTQHTEIQVGFSKEQTESMEHSTGIEVSASSDIGLAQYSVSLSYQFTYSSSTSHTHSTTSIDKREIEIPAHNFAVLFGKRIRLIIAEGDEDPITAESLAENEFHLSGGPLKESK